MGECNFKKMQILHIPDKLHIVHDHNFQKMSVLEKSGIRIPESNHISILHQCDTTFFDAFLKIHDFKN